MTPVDFNAIAASWRPRLPAIGDELKRLEAKRAVGTCLEPIVMSEDIVYYDTSLAPHPGDLIVCALSHRGAADQNSRLPQGEAPRCAGVLWLKLYLRHNDCDILLEKSGVPCRAALAACEMDGERLPLWPVRNIRRENVLIF